MAQEIREFIQGLVEVFSTYHEDESGVQTISDSEYAEELQIQEVLEASMADVQISHHEIDVPSSFGIGDKEEAGESSRKYCEICMEQKEINDMFKIEGCCHCFCCNCVAKHVQAKIEENNYTVTCPTLYCDYIIEPSSCRDIIPENVFARWEEARNKASILESQKFYCPFEDCSAMLVNDTEEGEIIRESACPVCQRLFCAKCHVPWHWSIDCEEFQKLKADERGPEDLMLHALAKEKKWTKCSNCKSLVDKIEGCIHMTCRCGFEFCYKCGLAWSKRHWSCQA